MTGDESPVDVVAVDAPYGDAADARDAADVPADSADGGFDTSDVVTADAAGDASDHDAVDGVTLDIAADAPDAVVADATDVPVVDAASDAADTVDSGCADVPVADDSATEDSVTDVPADTGAADDGGSPDVPDSVDAGGDAGSADALAIRIVASNLTSGPYQGYDYGHGMNILDALNPDIVLVQEFNYGDNTAADYDGFVSAVMGAGYWAVDDSTFQIPNGVVSRWPITASGYWDDPNISNRELMWATIDIPGPVDIMAISVHLHTSPSADQLEAAQVIVTRVKAHRQANPGLYMYVVGGDFNGTSSVSESGFGQDGTFYVDPPDPVDDEGNPNTNANRSKQYDFVLGDPAMHAFQVPVVFPSVQDSTSLTYPDGLVFDTRTFTQSVLDEYFPPADTGDSGASYMQHMAVVKDFLIQ